MTFLVLALVIISIVVALVVAVHPFWAIVECAVSDKLDGARKGLWILAMLLTWTLGSFLYGIFATYSPTLRRVTRGCSLLIMLLLVGCGLLLATRPELREALRTRVELTNSGTSQTQSDTTQALGGSST